MGRDLNPLGREPDWSAMDGKTPSKFTDPCKKASMLSMKCLEDNSYDKSKCALAFQNYRDCRKAWSAQRRAKAAEES